MHADVQPRAVQPARCLACGSQRLYEVQRREVQQPDGDFLRCAMHRTMSWWEVRQHSHIFSIHLFILLLPRYRLILSSISRFLSYREGTACLTGKRTPQSASSARVGSGALHGVSTLQISAPGRAPKDGTRRDKAGSPPRHNALTARQGRFHQTPATVCRCSVRESAARGSTATGRGFPPMRNAPDYVLVGGTSTFVNIHTYFSIHLSFFSYLGTV